MSDSGLSAPPEPIGDSPWLWACIFSGMALFVLVMMNRRIDQRQSQIEEKEHNRKVTREFQANQAAGKTVPEPASPPPVAATGGGYSKRQISVRPLMIFFACVTAVSAIGLIWQQCRVRGDPSAGHPSEKEPPA